MKKGLTVLIILAVVIVLVMVFLVIFSDKFGANKAKDLGVKFSDADLQSGRSQMGVTLEDLTSEDKSLEFSGTKVITGTYTSEMITAMISAAKYKYYPLTNTQIKIAQDGTIEAAGNFNIDKAMKWSKDLGTNKTTLNGAKIATSLISNNPSFYLSGKMTVKKNKINLNISKAKISRFNIPKFYINRYQKNLAAFVEQRISNVPNMDLSSVEFGSGAMQLNGTYAEVEKSLK